MSILGSVSYSLTTGKIVELVRESGRIVISSVAAKLLLTELVTRGTLIIDGDSWLYPWEERISHMFSSKPDIFFTIDDIIEHASVPPIAYTRHTSTLQSLLIFNLQLTHYFIA